MSSDRELRRTFDEAAASYHEARPAYPEELFDDLMGLLPSAPQILEIGPATGQATEPLLDRGAQVRAVEIGPKLAVALARRLAGRLESGALEVVVADYEQLEPERARFDAIVCATAYHWISPAEQLSRPPRWLTDSGRLMVIDTIQVESEVDGGFFHDSSDIYLRHGQAGARTLPSPEEAEPTIHAMMNADPRCVDATLTRYRWDQVYDADGYRALLNTYSGMLAMPPADRAALTDDLIDFVIERGGQVVRPLVITLATCRFDT